MITLFNLVTALAAEIADIIESGNFDTRAAELDYANRAPTNRINKSNIKLDIIHGKPLCASLRSEPIALSAASR